MAYVNPINSAQWGTARTDQGVDYIPKQADTPVVAIGNATVVYSSMQSGWPGGAFIAYQLNDGPQAGHYVYVAEHLTSLIPVGTKVAAGQQIALAQPGYPWTEWGWASGNSAGVLTPYNGSPDGTQTDGGKTFARFLMSLGAQVLENPGPGPLYPGGPSVDLAANPIGAGTPAQTASAAQGATWPPPGPPLPPETDQKALTQYIQTNYPADAWLLDIPEVKQTLEDAVELQLTPDQVTARMAGTAWWKSTSQSMIAFDKLRFGTPEELNFNDQGSKAFGVLTNVRNLAAQTGLSLDPATLQKIASQTMQYGWSNAQITQQLGTMVNVTTKGAGVTSNDPQLLAQLTAAAGSYLYNPTQGVLDSYAKAIASGRMTMDTYNAFLAQQAATKYPSMAEQIAAGSTPNQIIDPLRTEAATTMELNPKAINFISDPTYSKILNYRPPPAKPGQPAGAPRVMTTSEMDTYLRGTTEYGYTQTARNTASDLSNSIVKTFGKVAQ